jgi:hypothetical protein
MSLKFYSCLPISEQWAQCPKLVKRGVVMNAKKTVPLSQQGYSDESILVIWVNPKGEPKYPDIMSATQNLICDQLKKSGTYILASIDRLSYITGASAKEIWDSIDVLMKDGGPIVQVSIREPESPTIKVIGTPGQKEIFWAPEEIEGLEKAKKTPTPAKNTGFQDWKNRKRKR